jgi:hypothetical protein
VEQSVREKYSAAALLNPDGLADSGELTKALADLRFTLPEMPDIEAVENPREPAISKLVHDIGKAQFHLVLRKYFPLENGPTLSPVGGGWSGDPLVRVLARPDGTNYGEYYLKLFSSRDRFMKEISQHDAACAWLRSKGAHISLHYVPGLGKTANEQAEAFPPVKLERPPVFPVCYVSASGDTKRKTFKELYCQSETGLDAESALQRILEILQPDHVAAYSKEPPFASGRQSGCPFYVTDQQLTTILRASSELDRYGPAIWGDNREWEDCRLRVESLAHRPLGARSPGLPHVALGDIHGDPNPRNCLVNPANPKDVLMIDCGDYDPNGRLVSDLALIERDIKLTLMGNEKQLDGFYELDPRHLKPWCKMEAISIEKGLDYSSADVLPNACGNRAHILVTMIRKQAKALCGADDPRGHHYFAALLYWMIRALDERAIPPTKKLLALYSMAQILEFYFP